MGCKRVVGAVALVAAVVLPRVSLAGASAAAAPPTRVSISKSGGDTNGSSSSPAISSDGRYVAFASSATDLVKGDKNRVEDVFVRNLVSHTTTLVSVSTAGVAGNGASDEPSISANGRYVAFESLADNLTHGDTNGVSDIFVRDLVARTTKRMSVAPGGIQGNAESDTPIISADGSVVAFTSSATNLAGSTGELTEAFTHNLRNGSTLLAGIGAGEADCGSSPFYRFAAGLSADGKHIAIGVFCPGILYVYDRVRHSGATQLVTQINTGSGCGGDLSGLEYTPTGSTLAFVSECRGGGTVELFDTATGNVVDSIDPPQTGVYGGSLGISADGRRVVYVGGDGVPGDPTFGLPIGTPKVYSFDRSSGTLRYISVPLAGASADADKRCGGAQLSDYAKAPAGLALSADGSTVAFTCGATDIVAGDHNSATDVFARPVTSAPTPDVQPIEATADASVTEPTNGTTNVSISVTLDRPAKFDTGINLTFSDITAEAGVDYDDTPQYAYLSPGESQTTVQVPIYANADFGGNATFAVTASVSFGGAALGPHSNAVVTIHS